MYMHFSNLKENGSPFFRSWYAKLRTEAATSRSVLTELFEHYRHTSLLKRFQYKAANSLRDLISLKKKVNILA